MSATSRIFYQVLGIGVGPTPSTGYHFITGFNGVYTGANSGANLIQQLQRVQSVTDGFTIARTNVNQLGMLSILDRAIINPPSVTLGGSYYMADLSNERVLGLAVSGDYNVGSNAALTNILNKTQADKNYFIAVAPPGVDLINWTGQSQVFQITNGFLASYSTEGSVGNIPTTSFSVQGFNWATNTGSFNQPLMAIDPTLGYPVTGNQLFTLPVFTTGLANTASVLRPIDISLNLNNSAIGLDLTDIKIQSYSVSFDLNLQPLNQLGRRFPYSREIQFPVTLSASVTAYFGNVISGNLSNILCADSPYNLTIQLNDPCSTSATPAITYAVKGVKVDSQSFGAQDIGAIASTVTINYSTTIGGPTDLVHNLYISGRNI